MQAFSSHSEASYLGYRTGGEEIVDGKLRSLYIGINGRAIGYVDDVIAEPRSQRVHFHGFGRDRRAVRRVVYLSGRIDRTTTRTIGNAGFAAVLGPRGGVCGWVHTSGIS